jgi:hypothetical protein
LNPTGGFCRQAQFRQGRRLVLQRVLSVVSGAA